MKKCPNCGNNSPQENNICNHCGYSFKGSNGTSFTSVRGANNSSSSENFGSDLFGKLGSSTQKINNFFRSFFVIVFVIVIITFISSGYIIFNISKEFNENINNFDNFDDNIYTCEFLCNDSLSNILSESATSIRVSCQPETLHAVAGKSVIAFIARAIPITSMGTPSCVKAIVNPIIAPPGTGGMAKDTRSDVKHPIITHGTVISIP